MKRNLNKIQLKKDKVLSSIDNVLNQVATKAINAKDMDLLARILDIIAKCYSEKVDYYSNYNMRENYDRIDDVKYIWSEARKENELPEPRISDCVKGVQKVIPGEIEDYINFFPSDNKGVCRPQCVVLSTGDWEFGDTKFRNDILSYWYRCFFTNRFTVIFTESWQSGSWRKWKQLVDAYVAEQRIEVAGSQDDVNHTVVIIEYSDDGVQLRYCEKSV